MGEIYNLQDTLLIAGSSNGFLVRGVAGQRQVAPISEASSFFASVPKEEVSLAIVSADSSAV